VRSLRGWTDDVVLLTDGPADLDADGRARLTAAGVSVDERPVAELVSVDGELTSVVFADGKRMARGGMLVATTLHQRSRLAERLGATAAPAGPVAVDALSVDPLCRTTAPGVFAAGDVSAPMRPVAAAGATGSLAGAAVVQSLLADDVGLPVPGALVSPAEGERRVGIR
jgi:thioredoxin reductase